MILLDTNVLSALMVLDETVIGWLDQQPRESVWLTSITVFEANYGLALLPLGKRRTLLENALARVVTEDLNNRVIAFDQVAAAAAAELAARRRRDGRPVDFRDTQIAGIALARRATLATRNFRHFADLQTPVVDPWARD